MQRIPGEHYRRILLLVDAYADKSKCRYEGPEELGGKLSIISRGRIVLKDRPTGQEKREAIRKANNVVENSMYSKIEHSVLSADWINNPLIHTITYKFPFGRIEAGISIDGMFHRKSSLDAWEFVQIGFEEAYQSEAMR